MEVWRGKSVSGNKRKTKSPKKGLRLRKLGRNYSGFWLLVNTNHYNLCFCCVSPNMHHNHIILAGRKEGLEWERRQTLPVVFLYPVTLTTRGGHSVSTKNSAGLFQGPVIYRDILILFPTFPASAVCCRTLLLYSLRSQRRQHLEAIAVAKKCFVEGREGRGGGGCRAGTAARVSHGKWINAAGRTGSCHWGRSREVSVFSGKLLCRVQFVSELSGSRELHVIKVPLSGSLHYMHMGS